MLQIRSMFRLIKPALGLINSDIFMEMLPSRGRRWKEDKTTWTPEDIMHTYSVMLQFVIVSISDLTKLIKYLEGLSYFSLSSPVNVE